MIFLLIVALEISLDISFVLLRFFTVVNFSVSPLHCLID